MKCYERPAMKKPARSLHRTITGRTIDLKKLTRKERPFIARVLGFYKDSVEWSRFAALWIREFEKRGLEANGLAYRICQDMEARLGIAQGKVAPPDYRDYLAGLIEGTYRPR